MFQNFVTGNVFYLLCSKKFTCNYVVCCVPKNLHVTFFLCPKTSCMYPCFCCVLKLFLLFQKKYKFFICCVLKKLTCNFFRVRVKIQTKQITVPSAVQWVSNIPSNRTKIRNSGSQILTGPPTTKEPAMTVFRLLTGVIQ